MSSSSSSSTQSERVVVSEGPHNGNTPNIRVTVTTPPTGPRAREHPPPSRQQQRPPLPPLSSNRRRSRSRSPQRRPRSPPPPPPPTHRSSGKNIVGKCVIEERGALPYCQCKACGTSLTRNNYILAPTLRHLAYEQAGKAVPAFYRMGFGRVKAPFLHSLDAECFKIDEVIGPGHVDSEHMIDPSVGSHEDNVNLYRFKCGLYNYITRYGSPLMAEIWSLMSTVQERTAVELFRFLHARRPALASMNTIREVELALEQLVMLSLAVVPRRAMRDEKTCIPPVAFRAFVKDNIDEGVPIVLEYADQSLCDLRTLAIRRHYENATSKAVSMREPRNYDEIHAICGDNFKRDAYEYLALLLRTAWKEVREGDDVQIPLFHSDADLEAMLRDLRSADSRAHPTFVLRIIEKSLVRGKKRIHAKAIGHAKEVPRADEPDLSPASDEDFEDSMAILRGSREPDPKRQRLEERSPIVPAREEQGRGSSRNPRSVSVEEGEVDEVSKNISRSRAAVGEEGEEEGEEEVEI